MSTATHPVYWTVRRELWENRSIYAAPVIVGLLEIFGFLLESIFSRHSIGEIAAMESAQQQMAIGAGYGAVAVPILATAIVVGALYSLDSLYSERRDRSILFWKSLPVSDGVTVFGKALIPFAVLPVITFLAITATQVGALLITLLDAVLAGVDVSVVLKGLPWLAMPFVAAYTLATITLWYAPLYGWLFLVSAFASRKPLLWAVLPPLAVVVVEHIAFHTALFASVLRHRLNGFFEVAFQVDDPHRLPFIRFDQLAPLSLLSAPGMWAGLAVGAAFFVAATKLRRQREPN